MKIELNDLELRQLTETYGQKMVDKILAAHRETERVNTLLRDAQRTTQEIQSKLYTEQNNVRDKVYEISRLKARIDELEVMVSDKKKAFSEPEKVQVELADLISLIAKKNKVDAIKSIRKLLQTDLVSAKALYEQAAETQSKLTPF